MNHETDLNKINVAHVEAVVRQILEGMTDGQNVTGGAAVKAGQTGASAYTAMAPAAPAYQQVGRQVKANGGVVQTTMTLEKAVKLIEKIEAKAAQWGMRVVTAVADASGRPVAVHCMDGAYMGSFDVALNKTYTSIAFQMSTAELGKLAGPGESLYGIQFTNEGKIVIFGGGEVLKQNGVIIGSLGVSGGSAVQDTELAAYGKSVFEEVIACL